MAVANCRRNTRSNFCTDPKEIQRIKLAMMDTFDRLMEEEQAERDALPRGSNRRRVAPIPSLRAILKEMPFKVNERLATEIRQQLVVTGELPPPVRGNPNAAEVGAAANYVEGPSKEDIEAEIFAIQWAEESPFAAIEREHLREWAARQERIEVAKAVRRGDDSGTESFRPKGPKSEARRARAEYRRAWRSIREYARKNAILKGMANFWWNPES